MISLPFRRSRQAPNIAALYGMIVAQARLPAFYRGYGVPDTVHGRLDMIMMHLVLVLRALVLPGPASSPLGQQLFDRFCQDIDANFREMGVGDLTVPKEMQKVAEAFYGRAKAYEAGLAAVNSDELEAAVARNVFGAVEAPLGARSLAAYMREATGRLGRQSPSQWARGEIDFPDPAAMAPSALQHEHR
jgi:cytochrome b pre-mRNA-processing protein 3